MKDAGHLRSILDSSMVRISNDIALVAHGKNWKLIESGVETRTTSQVRSHAQKFFLKLQKLEKERKRNLKKGITSQSRSE